MSKKHPPQKRAVSTLKTTLSTQISDQISTQIGNQISTQISDQIPGQLGNTKSKTAPALIMPLQCALSHNPVK